MHDDDQSTLLTYALSADPAPIPVSTPQTTSQARVNISASAGQAVYCSQIVVAVPVGDDAPSLYLQPPAGSVNTNRWSVTAQVTTGSELWEGLDADQDYATFIYDCVSSADYLINYNLVFGVSGAVNGVLGYPRVGMQELSGTSSDPSTFTPKSAFFPLAKDLPQFYLQNLVATSPDAPTVPATDFASGAPIRLAWESNGTYFQLFQKNQPAPVYSGTATNCVISGGVARDTTFVLTASMTGSPGQDTPQGGYQPIYLYDSVTITVSNPVLTPTSVAVAGTLSVAGATTLAATAAGALTAASATVAGALQAGSLATGGTLNAGGTATVGAAAVSGSLSVGGGSTLNGATVNGSLYGTGSAQLNNLNVTGGLYAKSSQVSLIGSGVMLAQGTSIPQAWVGAQTDGFAVAQVWMPGDNGKSSFAYAQLWTAGNWFQIQGGTVGSFGSGWEDVMNNNPNLMCLPVPAGSSWSYYAANAGGNQMDSPSYIWWFPMGAGATAGEQTFRFLSQDEAAEASRLAGPRPAVPEFSQVVARREQAAEEFLGRLAEALGLELNDESRAELARLLRRL